MEFFKREIRELMDSIKLEVHIVRDLSDTI